MVEGVWFRGLGCAASFVVAGVGDFSAVVMAAVVLVFVSFAVFITASFTVGAVGVVGWYAYAFERNKSYKLIVL